MLKLRKEHLDAFEVQAIALFANRVLAHIKSVWPEQSAELTDPVLRSTIQTAIQRAATLGLTTEYDVARFVNLSFILAADFETNPLSIWTRPFITDKTLAPVAKLDRIYQRMEDEFTLIEKRRGPKT
jgi:hypothetical protein